jgi:hypothetical protein
LECLKYFNCCSILTSQFLLMRLSLGSGIKWKKAFLCKKNLVPPNSSKDFIVIIGIAARCSHFLICLVSISSMFYEQLLRTWSQMHKKRHSNSQCLFALLGPTRVKAARKMLMKSTFNHAWLNSQITHAHFNFKF